MSLNTSFTLSDGVKMPQFGLGLSKCKQGEEAEDAISHAIQTGYRLLDSAHLYGYVSFVWIN